MWQHPSRFTNNLVFVSQGTDFSSSVSPLDSMLDIPYDPIKSQHWWLDHVESHVFSPWICAHRIPRIISRWTPSANWFGKSGTRIVRDGISVRRNSIEKRRETVRVRQDIAINQDLKRCFLSKMFGCLVFFLQIVPEANRFTMASIDFCKRSKSLSTETWVSILCLCTSNSSRWLG